MDTSANERLAAIGILVAAVSVVGCANIYILACLILRRRVSRLAAIVWPVLGLLIALGVFDAFRIEPWWIQTSHHTVSTSRLAPGARLRIVQLADIHLEKPGLREKRMLDLTAAQHPDLIVLTGDHSSISDPPTCAALTRIARRLTSIAPTYAIEGNWDTAQNMAALMKGGVHILTDWALAPEREGPIIALGQVSWMRGRVPDPPKWTSSYFKVTLCHVPGLFKLISKTGVDLTLAGHTHGGQVRIPIFGAILPDRALVGTYQAGMYERNGRLLYVSRGIGMEGGPPSAKVRFCCRPEIAVIDIVGGR